MIEICSLTKYFGSKKAVNDVSFTVEKGEILGFLGPNGAGKSTTMRMITGFLPPSSGTAVIGGFDITDNPISARKRIGYLPENTGFYSDLNATQALRFIADLNRLSREVADERIESALAMVGLDSEAEKKVGAYSRGMRQRLGIAELLIKDPKVVFLDEPTLGLDPDATNRMIELIEGLCREKKMTVLLSSHMLHLVQKICHRVGIMIKGRMVAQGPMEQLAKEKLGIGSERYSLEEIYMKYFQEAKP